MEENTNIQLSREDFAEILKRFAGKDENGNPKCIISYQFFDAADAPDSPAKQTVYTTTLPSIEISYDDKAPEFYMVTITYRTCNDPELKLLWGRLNRFKHAQAIESNKDWLFYIQILEKGCVSLHSEVNDTLWICDIFNPTFFTLCREVPDFLAPDVKVDDTLQGGNQIRLLVPYELISFRCTNDIDTQTIKAELLEEEATANFLEGYKEQQAKEE